MQPDARAHVIGRERPHALQSDMQIESTLRCPVCGHRARERMPTDACQFFYECKGCGQRLKPKPGDCCVFCSYGTALCPPKQAGLCCSQDIGMAG